MRDLEPLKHIIEKLKNLSEEELEEMKIEVQKLAEQYNLEDYIDENFEPILPKDLDE